VPVIAIAGDVESSLLDSDALEELNPYKFFDTAALYIGRLVNPGQLRPMVSTAITTAVAGRLRAGAGRGARARGAAQGAGRL
jgi:pyruvate dehydrogenase (quinone)